MSQAKVDKYKQEKANRQQIIAKEKRQRLITKICGFAIAIAIVAWAGYSGYTSYQNNHVPDKTVIDTTAVDDYVSGLND